MKKLFREGLSFDDVTLIPAYSEITREDVSTSVSLTKGITLNAPIIAEKLESAAAIALARQGGIGIISKDMSIDLQAIEVDRVKRSEHGVMTKPFSLSANHYVYEAEEIMSRYQISGVPITEHGKLVGIVTNRDLRFEADTNKKIYEIMTRENLITAPEGTTLLEAKSILMKNKIEKLPLVDSKGNLKGLITIKDIQKTIKYPNSAKDSHGRLLAGAAVCAGAGHMERVRALAEVEVDIILIDSEHGHSRTVIECINEIKQEYPDLQVIAGDVFTAEAAETLIKAGADAVKIGIGAKEAGVGVPFLTALLDCVEAAESHKVPVIASGIRFSDEFTKAIAAGANSCVLDDVQMFDTAETIAAVSGLINALKTGMAYCGCKTPGEFQEHASFIINKKRS